MKKICRTAVYSMLALVLALSSVFAQKSPQFQYAVKFICGKPPAEVLATGDYRTAINVHNPGESTIEIRGKFAQALPGKQGVITKWTSAKLGPDGALEIDCSQVSEWLKSSPVKLPFAKGFVVIESDNELDIVAVYTAAGRDGEVRTLELERVTPRRIVAGCCDLIVDSIATPTWDAANKRSVIHAVIKNIGTASAGASVARVVDPTTFQTPGVPYNEVAVTPPLAPGQSTTVTFFLPYWVDNPDVTLEVTADYKAQVPECDETNNTRVFSGIG